MKIVIHYQGEQYQSKEACDVTAETAATNFYEGVSESDVFKMELQDGGYVVLGKEALLRAAVLFLD